MEQTCLPNLFIVGAAKCGTTTLHDYLNQHTSINMSAIKEPHFMLKDIIYKKKYFGKGDEEIIKNYITSEDKYKKLFKNTYQYNGESSPGYFTYPNISIKNIRKYSNNAKIIICLRNPVQRTYSAYLHKVRNGLEKKDFYDIINQRIDLKREKKGWAWGWYYISDSFYYEKCKLFLDSFKDVKIVLFENLISNEIHVLNEIADFLELKSKFKDLNKKQKNKTGVIKFPTLYKMTKKSIGHISPLINKNVKEKIKNIFLHKPPINSEIKKQLESLFREDINNLSSLIDKDLGKIWLDK